MLWVLTQVKKRIERVQLHAIWSRRNELFEKKQTKPEEISRAHKTKLLRRTRAVHDSALRYFPCWNGTLICIFL